MVKYVNAAGLEEVIKTSAKPVFCSHIFSPPLIQFSDTDRKRRRRIWQSIRSIGI